MVTFAIGAEKLGKPLMLIDGTKDVYPFPKNLSIGRFRSEAKAHHYIETHTNILRKLLSKKGYTDYDISVIRIDAPHVLYAPRGVGM